MKRFIFLIVCMLLLLAGTAIAVVYLDAQPLPYEYPVPKLSIEEG